MLGSCVPFRVQEIFTADRLADLIHLNEALFEALRRGVERVQGCANASTLVCLTKLLALFSSCATLAERGGVRLLRMAHRGVMATACPRHAPLQHQDRGLILPFDLANSAPCPGAAAHAVSYPSRHISLPPDLFWPRLLVWAISAYFYVTFLQVFFILLHLISIATGVWGRKCVGVYSNPSLSTSSSYI